MTRTSTPMRHAFALILALVGTAGAFAQECPFVIKDVDFQVKGRTLSFVMMQKLVVDGPLLGRSFHDRKALDAYVADRRQILLDTRLFTSVGTGYEFSPREGGGTEVLLRFSVVDTWNIVALPKPVISSNTGVDIYVKAKDYNFLGSMQTLTLAPDLKWDATSAHHFSGEVDTSFSVPFRAAGADWSLSVSETLQDWTIEQTLRSLTSLGLTYNFPNLYFPASISLTQGYNYNADIQYPGYPESDPDFLVDTLSGTAHIPVGLSLGGSLGKLYYDPTLSLTENWWPGTTMHLWGREGPSASLANMISAGRIDWIGNQRQGVTVTLRTQSSYNVQTQDFVQDLSLQAEGTWHSGERIGLVAQATVTARPLGYFGGGLPLYSSIESGIASNNDYLTGLGSSMRGIIDNRINGVAGLFANLSMPVRLFDFPTHVLIKKDWLDFELQAQPFIDAGAVVPAWGASFPGRSEDYPSADWRQWLWASGGLEFLFFPGFMKNFIIRASLGWDLISVLENRSLTKTTWDGASPYEYYFGTGLAY